jgi:UDP-N-acetylglucosamine 2-epimerase
VEKMGVRFTEPQGFLEFLRLEEGARVIVSDSGTVQEEALLLGVPCLITRRSTERPETIRAGGTRLADDNLYRNALRAMRMKRNWDRSVLNPEGGSPSLRICRDLCARIRNGWFGRSRTLAAIRNDVEVQRAYGLRIWSSKRSR